MLRGWLPSDITTALWLDAADTSTITQSGGSVSQWIDKKANGYGVSQGIGSLQPQIGVDTINGLNVLSFDGGDDTLVGQNIAAYLTGKNYTLFSVLRTATVQDNVLNSHYVSLSGTGTAIRGYIYKTNANELSFAFGNTNPTVSMAKTDGSIALVCAQKTSSTLAKVWLDGETKGQFATTYSGTLTHLSIGGFQGGQSNCANIKVGEIVIVEGTMTESDRLKMEGYLAWRWGLTASLPTDHPYKTTRPTV